MTRRVRTLIDQGSDLSVPPRTREERREFAAWLASALEFMGMSRAALAMKTRIPREDIDAMIDTESNWTAKEDRSLVHDVVLADLEKGAGRVFPRGADVTNRVSEVLEGRGEFATFFSPRDDLKSAILQVIARARTGILVQAWDLSCPRVSDALTGANVGTGKIKVAVSAPRKEKLSSALLRLAKDPKVQVLSDRSGRKNHNKSIVVDRRVLLTGSVNFNYGSGVHDENMLITSRPDVVAMYVEDFDAKLPRLEQYGR